MDIPRTVSFADGFICLARSLQDSQDGEIGFISRINKGALIIRRFTFITVRSCRKKQPHLVPCKPVFIKTPNKRHSGSIRAFISITHA